MLNLSNTTNFILNAIVHLTLVFIFLTFLFIYLVSPIAKKAFNSEIDHIIHEQIDIAIPNKIDLTNEVNNINNRKQIIKQITEYINNYYLINNQDPTQTLEMIDIFNKGIDSIIDNNMYQQLIDTYSKPNYLISIHNNSIVNISIYLSIVLLVFSTALIIADKMSCNSCIHLSSILIENFFIFAIVGTFEYWFFINYASKYLPVPPSTLTNTSIDNIKKIL
jgi:hypothetical protein